MGLRIGVMLIMIALVGVTASAASLTINDTLQDGEVMIAAGYFETGFFVNGGLVASGSGSGSVIVPEAPGFTFTGSWIDLGASAPGSRTVYFVNPNDPSDIFDILSYTYSTDGYWGTISGAWSSALGGPLGSIPGGTAASDIMLANGQPFGFSNAYISAGAYSSTEVPEPSTALLLACGLGGGFVVLRRRRWRA